MSDRATSPTSGVPAEMADYVLLGPLGNGGRLHLAAPPLRLALDAERVVVKVVPGGSDAGFRRFVRELKLFARVNSPRLVSVYDAGQHEEWFFSSMEYCAGGSLLEPAAPLSVGDRLDAVRSAALAVHDLHESGIAHRDIRPSNVLRRGDGSWVMSDLDYAYAGSGSVTSMAPLASIGFLDPGTLLGETNGRASDIYSLGALLHWTLTGHLVHPSVEGADAMMAVRAMLRHRPHVRRDELSASTATLIESCIESDPAHRPPTALVVADIIEEISTAQAVETGGQG